MAIDSRLEKKIIFLQWKYITHRAEQAEFWGLDGQHKMDFIFSFNFFYNFYLYWYFCLFQFYWFILVVLVWFGRKTEREQTWNSWDRESAENVGEGRGWKMIWSKYIAWRNIKVNICENRDESNFTLLHGHLQFEWQHFLKILCFLQCSLLSLLKI